MNLVTFTEAILSKNVIFLCNVFLIKDRVLHRKFKIISSPKCMTVVEQNGLKSILGQAVIIFNFGNLCWKDWVQRSKSKVNIYGINIPLIFDLCAGDSLKINFTDLL